MFSSSGYDTDAADTVVAEEPGNDDVAELADLVDINYDDDEDDDEDLVIEDDEQHEEENQIEAEISRQGINPILDRSNSIQFDIIVPDNERITSSMLTQSELAYVLSVRAKEIADTATVFGPTIPGEHNPVKLAIQELLNKKNPLILRRAVGVNDNGDHMVELWKVREMSIPAIGTMI